MIETDAINQIYFRQAVTYTKLRHSSPDTGFAVDTGADFKEL